MYTSVFQETMAELNWQEVQQLAGRNAPVLFPVGVIEEHGPHLPLGSDIYWSYAISRLVKAKLNTAGRDCAIAPPYYWGVNHCTGGFPGSFSLKPATMSAVLYEIFENLAQFSFRDIYCFNYHGDAVHVGALVDTIRRANSEQDISARLVVEGMDLQMNNWTGQEDFLLVVNPAYPTEWFEGAEPAGEELFDIHAGAFETAVLGNLIPSLVDLDKAGALRSASLSREGLRDWAKGGENAKAVVPLGYAGDPANHGAVGKHVAEMLSLQAETIVRQILAG